MGKTAQGGIEPGGGRKDHRHTNAYPLQLSDDSLKFLVPASWKPGVYSFEINADGRKSAPTLLNAPDPWWQQGDWGKEASPGGWLRIFGKCLSFDAHAAVLLRSSGKDTTLKPKQQDCWSLNVELPGDLSAGEYQVLVYNGYESQAGWKERERPGLPARFGCGRPTCLT